jgi:chromosome segregation ATPase
MTNQLVGRARRNGREAMTKQHEVEQEDNDLSAPRQAAVEQGLAMFHQTAEERDGLQKEVAKLKSDIAGYRVALDAKDAQIADMESRNRTMQLERDEAVAQRMKYETFYGLLLAQFRTFPLPAVPIVKMRSPEEQANAEPIRQ